LSWNPAGIVYFALLWGNRTVLITYKKDVNVFVDAERVHAKPVFDGCEMSFYDTVQPGFFGNFTFCSGLCGFTTTDMPLG